MLDANRDVVTRRSDSAGPKANREKSCGEP
jgi:hypothetical protein